MLDGVMKEVSNSGVYQKKQAQAISQTQERAALVF